MIPPVPRGGVIFDCDGTLVSTRQAWSQAYAALFAAYDRPCDLTAIRPLVGMPLKPLGYALADLLEQPGRQDDLLDQIRELVGDNGGCAVRPQPGVMELVEALRASRPMAVASNTPKILVRRFLHEAGLDDVFSVVLGCDDVAAPKPAPDIYTAACALLGVPPDDAVAVEDCEVGTAAARSAGLFVVGVDASGAGLLAADLIVSGLDDPRLWQALRLRPWDGLHHEIQPVAQP